MSTTITSNYDLLASYSTAATVESGASASGNSDFVQLVNELLDETSAMLTETLSTNESDEPENTDVPSDEEPENEDDSDTSDNSNSGNVTDSYSVYMRPDGDDPLSTDDTPSDELSFYDMLNLMILQFQNQTIDDTASTTDMMNQLVQMTTMQAMTSMEDSITAMTKTNEMLYTSSLVGQEVTVGYYDDGGNFIEEIGVVSAAGYYGGYPVVFFEGKDTFFYTSEILAVGKLPTATEDTEVEEPEDTDSTEGTAGTEGSGSADESDDVNDTAGSGGVTEEDESSADVDPEEEVDAGETVSSLYGYNYVDYSSMTAEEIIEASSSALG